CPNGKSGKLMKSLPLSARGFCPYTSQKSRYCHTLMRLKIEEEFVQLVLDLLGYANSGMYEL
ncbi:unnamed protein product, partial [marine sediment metagenome]